MSLNYKPKKKDKVVIFGHKGLIGSALINELNNRKYKNIICITKKN